MDNDGKLEAIKYMCKMILEDTEKSRINSPLRMVLKSILEVIDG